MEEIVWSDRLSVGIIRFDEQHKQLVTMLNKLIRDPALTTTSETGSEVLANMTQYAREHFKSEEELMIEFGYPDYEEHRARHLSFLYKVVEFCSKTNLGDETIPDQLLEFLKNWLATHILEEDMDYKYFFIAKGVK